MHICLVTSSYPTAPDDLALPFLPGFATALEDRGHRVTVLTPDRRGGRASPADERVCWFRWLGGRRPVVSLGRGRPGDVAAAAHLLSAGWAAAAALQARDPIDHLLALFALPSGAIGWALRTTHAVPYSVWALGSDVLVWGRRQPFRAAIGAILRDAYERFADGYGLAEEVAELSGRPCGFLPTVRALPPPASIQLDPAERHLLFLGRLEPVKGLDVLLEAFRSAPLGLRLHVVGTGSLVGQVNGERVTFHGPAGPAEVAGWLHAADLLVLPSRSESVPTALLEAAQAGLPAIASAVGDVPRVIEQYELGATVQPGDPRALAVAIAAWAAKPRHRLPSSIVARARADLRPHAAADAFLAAIGGPAMAGPRT